MKNASKERVFVTFELGEVFRNKRKEKGLSQEELGNEINVSQTIISKIENGAYQANKDNLEKMCAFFGMDVTEMQPYIVKKSLDDALDIKLKLISIEHDLDMVNPGEGLEELRRLEGLRKMESGKKDPLFAYFHYLRGKYYEKKRKWNEVFPQYESAIKYVDTFPELLPTNLKAASFNGLGRACIKQSNFHHALSYVEKGIQFFVPNGERLHVRHHLLITKAIILEKLNRDSEAFLIVEEIWPQEERMETAEARLSLTQIRIELLNKLHRYDEAIQSAIEGLEKARVDQMFDHCFELWSSLGESYVKLGLLANAEICYQSALKLEKNIKRKNMLVTIYTQLGLLYLEQHILDDAQSALEQAVKLGKKVSDDFKLVKALIALGHCLLKQNNDFKALKYLKEALQLSEQHSFETLQFDILLQITDICKRNHLSCYQNFLEQFQQIAVQLQKRR